MKSDKRVTYFTRPLFVIKEVKKNINSKRKGFSLDIVNKLEFNPVVVVTIFIAILYKIITFLPQEKRKVFVSQVKDVFNELVDKPEEFNAEDLFE